ncbi:MAG: hypothetical protein UMS36scaffold28_7 [Phage 59_13]|nr:MAG: hypothetical protein UMS36scaffold28_7 [Phage 59_13]
MAKVGKIKAEKHGSDDDGKLQLSADEVETLKQLLDDAATAAGELDSDKKCGVVTLELDGEKIKIGTAKVDVADDEE